MAAARFAYGHPRRRSALSLAMPGPPAPCGMMLLRRAQPAPTSGSHSLRPGALVGVALPLAVPVAAGVREGLAVADAVAVGVGERQGVLG